MSCLPVSIQKETPDFQSKAVACAQDGWRVKLWNDVVVNILLENTATSSQYPKAFRVLVKKCCQGGLQHSEKQDFETCRWHQIQNECIRKPNFNIRFVLAAQFLNKHCFYFSTDYEPFQFTFHAATFWETWAKPSVAQHW